MFELAVLYRAKVRIFLCLFFWAGLGLTCAVALSPWLHRLLLTAGAEAPLGTGAFCLCPHSWTPWHIILCDDTPHLISQINRQSNCRAIEGGSTKISYAWP